VISKVGDKVKNICILVGAIPRVSYCVSPYACSEKDVCHRGQRENNCFHNRKTRNKSRTGPSTRSYRNYKTRAKVVTQPVLRPELGRSHHVVKLVLLQLRQTSHPAVQIMRVQARSLLQSRAPLLVRRPNPGEYSPGLSDHDMNATTIPSSATPPAEKKKAALSMLGLGIHGGD
jgi:hypothetical protein